MKDKDCPDEYYNNCELAALKCGGCRAMTGGQRLYYKPINPEISPHPAEAKDHNAGRARARGIKNEKMVENRLAKRLVKTTIASGAKLQDGDLEIHSATDPSKQHLSIECKDRGKIKRWFLTRDEYRHGIEHGVNVFAITRTDPESCKTETVYLLSEDLFAELTAGYITS